MASKLLALCSVAVVAIGLSACGVFNGFGAPSIYDAFRGEGCEPSETDACSCDGAGCICTEFDCGCDFEVGDCVCYDDEGDFDCFVFEDEGSPEGEPNQFPEGEPDQFPEGEPDQFPEGEPAQD